MIIDRHCSGPKEEKMRNEKMLLLPASVELFDRTELIEKLLIDQPRHEEELVV